MRIDLETELLRVKLRICAWNDLWKKDVSNYGYVRELCQLMERQLSLEYWIGQGYSYGNSMLTQVFKEDEKTDYDKIDINMGYEGIN